ncbi:unnamed protein product [Choristocarpus tenellus]
MIQKISKLNFSFFSIYPFSNMVFVTKSLFELYSTEHFNEFRQRFFHTLIFFFLSFLILFANIKLIVQILENPVLNVKFFQFSPGEYFLSTLKISFSSGLLFLIPFLLNQILFFFFPALDEKQKKILFILFINSILLFLGSLFFSYFLLIPAALNFFINYSIDVIEPLWSFEPYFEFVSSLFLSTGLVFQIPIILIVLSLSKLINPTIIFNYWRFMLFFSTLLGAILTPSADPVTQLILSVALFFLYISGSLISIFLLKKNYELQLKL